MKLNQTITNRIRTDNITLRYMYALPRALSPCRLYGHAPRRIFVGQRKTLYQLRMDRRPRHSHESTTPSTCFNPAYTEKESHTKACSGIREWRTKLK